jgi:two-component sensor histidine kinase
MFQASLDHLSSPAAEGITHAEPADAIVAMRQLRHQTKNALQRIIAQVASSDLRATEAGTALADDLERRICLSARISDALFGMTSAPGPLETRLTALCNATVALLAHPKQTISVDVTVAGTCPDALQALVVQVAHEMVGNAVKHGLHMRLTGRISLRLWAGGTGDAGDTSVTLMVSDNGWGPRKTTEGDGLPIMRALAEQYNGTVSLSRDDGWTAARLYIPSAAMS